MSPCNTITKWNSVELRLQLMMSHAISVIKEKRPGANMYGLCGLQGVNVEQQYWSSAWRCSHRCRNDQHTEACATFTWIHHPLIVATLCRLCSTTYYYSVTEIYDCFLSWMDKIFNRQSIVFDQSLKHRVMTSFIVVWQWQLLTDG